MQNTNIPNTEHKNPQHFQDSSITTISNPTPCTSSDQREVSTTAAQRTQKFSFSSAYNASRFNSTNSYNSNKFHNTLFAGNNHHDHKAPISSTSAAASFTIIHNDHLNRTFTGKPNAIVHPIRRTSEHPAFAGSRQNQHNSNNNNSNQQQNHPPPQHNDDTSMHYAQTGSVAQPTVESCCSNTNEHHFAEELNRKLRYLRNRENNEAWAKLRNFSTRNGNSNQDELLLNKRPLFITTVPTGVFLPPPKEIPLPPYLTRHVYAYSSHPIVLSYNSNNITTTTTNKTTITTTTTTFPKDRFHGSSTNTAAAITATGLRGHFQSSTLDGGMHLTKQQFQQQLQQHRAKRETPPEPYKNVMYDRRVIRGSNYGNTQLLMDSDPFDKAAELRRRHALRKKNITRNQRNVLGTPPPVAGRHHEVIQTDKYLEELVQRPPEFSVDTQTDLFLERPPTPPYIPAKVGVDAATEIGDGELFHFDAEAQPIIEILVDSCIEQSMLEIAHEQEIQALRKKQEEYLAQREAELAELRRLEAEEIRLQAEKERRLRQDAIAKELDEEMQKGVTAAKLLQGHIAGLLPEVLENLEPATDAVKKEQLMRTVCPWLTAEVAEEVGQIVDSREILTVIIQEIIKQRAEVYAGYKEEAPQQLKAITFGEEGEGESEQQPECCKCETEDTESCPPHSQ